MSKPNVSVVLCSYNRADHLEEALESLKRLHTASFTYEIVVVDNASTDHTKDVVTKAAMDSEVALRYVMESDAGVSFARNRGVREAQGEWLAFFDDDEIADPNWLIELLKSAKEKNVKCVGGGIRLRLLSKQPRALRPWIRAMCNCTQGVTEQFYTTKMTPGTGNMMVHREIFDEIGFFRTDLVEGGEDTDLYHRMRAAGYQAFHAPDALVEHRVPEFRLEPKFLKPASMRMGSHIARREYNSANQFVFVMRMIARSGQVFLWFGGYLLAAKALGDKEHILERQSRWWLGLGYLEAAQRFLRWKESKPSMLEFRKERLPVAD